MEDNFAVLERSSYCELYIFLHCLCCATTHRLSPVIWKTLRPNVMADSSMGPNCPAFAVEIT